MKSKKKIAGLTTLVAASLIFMLWLADLLHFGKIAPGVAPLPGAAPGRTVPAQEVEIPLELTIMGTVISQTLTHISSQVPGKVSRIWVEAGSRVKQGDPLVALSAPEYEARRRSAQGAAAQAQAALNQTRADYQRYQRLRKEEAVSPQEFDAVEARFKAAQAAAAQTQGQLQEAAAFKDYTVISAPREGVVAERRAASGDLAQPGRPLIVLYDPRELQIEGEVNDDYRPLVKVGLPVKVEVPAAAWEAQTALTEVFPISQTGSRTFKVRTGIIAAPMESRGGVPPPAPAPSPARAQPGAAAPSTPLVPGMFARLTLPVGQTRAIVIPRAAVRQVGQLPMVEVLVDGRPYLRQIKLGRPLGDRVEVLSGLKPGEQALIP